MKQCKIFIPLQTEMVYPEGLTFHTVVKTVGPKFFGAVKTL